MKAASKRFFVLDGLRGVAALVTGEHLQSLALCARGDVLAAIGGFPTAADYHEATIAEIALFKKMEALGLLMREVGRGRSGTFCTRNRVAGVVRSWLRAVALRVRVDLKELLQR